MLFKQRIFLTVCLYWFLMACSGGGGGGGDSSSPVTATSGVSPSTGSPVTAVDGIQVKSSIDKSAVFAGDSVLIVDCGGPCAVSVGGTTYSRSLSMRSSILLKSVSSSTYASPVGSSAFIISITKNSVGISVANIFNSGLQTQSGLPITLPNKVTIKESATGFGAFDKDDKDISATNLYSADLSQIDATINNSTFIAAACVISENNTKISKILATFVAKNQVIASTVAGNPAAIAQVISASGNDVAVKQVIDDEVKKREKRDAVLLAPSVKVPWQCPSFDTDWTKSNGEYKDATGHMWRVYPRSPESSQSTSAWSEVFAQTDRFSAYMECTQKNYGLVLEYKAQAPHVLGSCALDNNDTAQWVGLVLGSGSTSIEEISAAKLVCQEPTAAQIAEAELKVESDKIMKDLRGKPIICPDIAFVKAHPYGGVDPSTKYSWSGSTKLTPEEFSKITSWASVTSSFYSPFSVKMSCLTTDGTEFQLSIYDDMQSFDYIDHCNFDDKILDNNKYELTLSENIEKAKLTCPLPTEEEKVAAKKQKDLEDASRKVMDGLLVNGTEITCPNIKWANENQNGGIDTTDTPGKNLKWYRYNDPANKNTPSITKWDSVSANISYFSDSAVIYCEPDNKGEAFYLYISNNEPSGIIGSCTFNSDSMVASRRYSSLDSASKLKCKQPTPTEIQINSDIKNTLNKQLACPTVDWANKNPMGGIDPATNFFWGVYYSGENKLISSFDRILVRVNGSSFRINCKSNTNINYYLQYSSNGNYNVKCTTKNNVTLVVNQESVLAADDLISCTDDKSISTAPPQ